MVNICFGKLMRTGDIGRALETTPDYFPPFMEIDPGTFRCSLTADKRVFVNMYEGDVFTAHNPSINVYIYIYRYTASLAISNTSISV